MCLFTTSSSHQPTREGVHGFWQAYMETYLGLQACMLQGGSVDGGLICFGPVLLNKSFTSTVMLLGIEFNSELNFFFFLLTTFWSYMHSFHSHYCQHWSQCKWMGFAFFDNACQQEINSLIIGSRVCKLAAYLFLLLILFSVHQALSFNSPILSNAQTSSYHGATCQCHLWWIP